MTTITPIYPRTISLRRWRRSARFLFIVALIVVSIWLLSLRQASSLPAAVPDGLTANEWQHIQSQIAAAEYRFMPMPIGSDAYAAPNRAQDWQVAFSPAGTQVYPANGFFNAVQDQDWSWGLMLTGYGYGDKDLTDLQNPSANSGQVLSGLALTADKETIVYQWDDNLSEWWINSPAGLEQGFTLQRRPPFAAPYTPLVLEMVVSGSLTPALDDGVILFQDDAGKTILRYDRLHVVDADGETIPARLQIAPLSVSRGNIIQIVVDDAEAAYPLTIDPWLESAILHASDAQASDLFGGSVAVSGDTAVIGASFEDGGAGNPALYSGAAYVFERDLGGAGVWGEAAILHASDVQASDLFGVSVAVSGDTAVIGAYYEDGGAGDPVSDSGAAYVFERDLGGMDAWGEAAILHASDAQASDHFGVSVAVSGDTAVIGAAEEDGGTGNPASDSGAVYIFERDLGGTGAWGEAAILRASDAQSGDYFGRAVAVSGDTAVIGAFLEDGGAGNPALYSGAAYIFERNLGGAGAWGEAVILHASDAQVSDFFGFSAAVSGDTAVIGANVADGGAGDPAIHSGAAYVFERDLGGAGAWGEAAILHASDAQASDNFGMSVAVSGDTVVIGASQEDGGAGNPAANSGAVYAFERDLGGAGAWGEASILRASNADSGDRFGFSVAASGDTVVIGADMEDGAVPNSDTGAAYIFGSCIRSAQNGLWDSATTWAGGVAPVGADGVCVLNGHTITLGAAAAADTLWVYSGGILDLATHTLSVETSVRNDGAMQQTKNVNASSVVNFMQIQPNGGGADLYRGLDIATDGSNNLGATIVRVMGNTAVCNNNDGGSYRNRCFMVNPTNAGSASLTLRTTPGEDDISDDAFFQYASGTTWTQGTTCADGIGVGGACMGTGTFASPAWFLIGSQGSSPTAVTLQSISANSGTAILPALIIMLLLAGLGGVVLRRCSN
ncbi:MAG: hypothetical protein GY803_20465 [Chloroflexi bacterium]|nr:hypothetical protein [Chloroflexota bacterium]